MRRVLPNPVAGKWYQDSASLLRFDLKALAEDLQLMRRRGVCAAVVPHAGYRFSGRVAAGVYLRLDPREYDRIVVMAPSHYVAMENQVSIADATHYSTPLGLVEADVHWIERARKLPFVTENTAAHLHEHADQIQLPMLQMYVSARIPVVCIICGQFDAKHAVEAGRALRGLLDKRTLVVASSDFTHFGATFDYTPFENNVQENIEAVDRTAFELFASKDVEGFLRYIRETGATICGRDPLALLIAMMPSDANVRRTGYDTSGRQTNNAKTSVSYVGALVEGSWETSAAPQPLVVSHAPVADCDGAALLTLARDTLRRAYKLHTTHPIWGAVPRGVTPGMQTHHGAFATIRRNGLLRGCIGEIFPRREVWKAVSENVLLAAFKDPRFQPLTEEEFKDVTLEIFVLSKPRPVDGWKCIELGKHGIVMRKGMHSAVFLPQVATEEGWSLEETLSHLSLKAGLDEDAWKSGTDFLVFEAQVFSETTQQGNKP